MRLTKTRKIKIDMRRRILSGAMAVLLAAAMAGTGARATQAAEEGTYLVTIVPSYKDPETGNIEDPGNNEAIGQGMTERMCGSTALLEVDASGNMYLTVRYYLSQFINNVVFEERNGGSFQELSYREVQSKEAVEGASDIAEKYGYTDYRMKISSLDHVYRGKAFIVPAGRNVVFFFTARDPVPGSGDFLTAKPSKSELPVGDKAALEEEDTQSQIVEGELKMGLAETEDGEDEFVNGSGEIDDPVTGIPKKPSITKKEETVYHLETSYDLSKVPMEEAKAQTEQLLDGAIGIVKLTGSKQEEEENLNKEKGPGGSQKVMMGLFGVSAVLVAYMGLGSLKGHRETEDET